MNYEKWRVELILKDKDGNVANTDCLEGPKPLAIQFFREVQEKRASELTKWITGVPYTLLMVRHDKNGVVCIATAGTQDSEHVQNWISFWSNKHALMDYREIPPTTKMDAILQANQWWADLRDKSRTSECACCKSAENPPGLTITSYRCPHCMIHCGPISDRSEVPFHVVICQPCAKLGM